MTQVQEFVSEDEDAVDKILAIIYPRIRSFLGGTASGVAKCVVGHPFDTIKGRLIHNIHIQ